MVSFSAGVPRGRGIFHCICKPDDIYYLYNKWPNQGLYKRNHWTLSCVTTPSFHHNCNIDMYLSLSALSGEVVPLHVVDVICVMLCTGA